MRFEEEPQPKTGSPAERILSEAESLGAEIRAARRKQGLGQQDVAFAANVSPRTVFAIEKGKSTVRFDMLARVLAAVGLRLATEPRDRTWNPLHRP